MASLEVFDPPLCCSTGVCGPDVDPRLPQFAADLDWLAGRGVRVTRYNLAQEPGAFVANPTVSNLLARWGTSCLPLLVGGERIVARGRYPVRAELAGWFGLAESAT
jgi:hypothetical protein